MSQRGDEVWSVTELLLGVVALTSEVAILKFLVLNLFHFGLTFKEVLVLMGPGSTESPIS